MAPQSGNILALLRNSWSRLDASIKRNLIWATVVPFLLSAAMLIYALLPGLVAAYIPNALGLTALILYIGPMGLVLAAAALIPYYLIFKAHHAIRGRYLGVRFAGEPDAVRTRWSAKDGWMLGICLIGLTALPGNIVSIVCSLVSGSFFSMETVTSIAWMIAGLALAPTCCHRYVLMDE